MSCYSMLYNVMLYVIIGGTYGSGSPLYGNHATAHRCGPGSNIEPEGLRRSGLTITNCLLLVVVVSL